MFTKFTDQNGLDVKIITQQYETGTYFIINNDPRRQGSLDMNEKDFHRKIRSNAEEDGCTNIIGSSLE